MEARLYLETCISEDAFVPGSWCVSKFHYNTALSPTWCLCSLISCCMQPSPGSSLWLGSAGNVLTRIICTQRPSISSTLSHTGYKCIADRLARQAVRASKASRLHTTDCNITVNFTRDLQHRHCLTTPIIQCLHSSFIQRYGFYLFLGEQMPCLNSIMSQCPIAQLRQICSCPFA